MGDNILTADVISLEDFARSRPISRRSSALPSIYMAPPPSSFRALDVLLKLAGVWLMDRPLLMWQTGLKVASGLAVVGIVFSMCLCMTLEIVTMKQESKDSSADIATVLLKFFDAAAHIRCNYSLWKFERKLAKLFQGISSWKFYKRDFFLLAFLCASIVVTIVRTALIYRSLHANHTSPAYLNEDTYQIGAYISYAPVQLIWHCAMILYLILTWSIIDEVEETTAALAREITFNEYIDYNRICLQSMRFRAGIRTKIATLNQIFSFLVLVLHLRIFMSVLTSLREIVAKHPLEGYAWILETLFLLCGITAYSWTSSRLMRTFHSSADDIELLLVKRKDCNFPMIAEVKKILDFDSTRDALTIWDSFIFSKGTTVTILVGMFSLIAIILQFDQEFRTQLEQKPTEASNDFANSSWFGDLPSDTDQIVVTSTGDFMPPASTAFPSVTEQQWQNSTNGTP